MPNARQQRLPAAIIAAIVLLFVGRAAADDSGLTPIGAEQAGNADGSIPPWLGGIDKPPQTTIRRGTVSIRIRAIR